MAADRLILHNAGATLRVPARKIEPGALSAHEIVKLLRELR
jgi:hypothetical protein